MFHELTVGRFRLNQKRVYLVVSPDLHHAFIVYSGTVGMTTFTFTEKVYTGEFFNLETKKSVNYKLLNHIKVFVSFKLELLLNLKKLN